MKKIIVSFLAISILASCSLFLEKPDTTGTVDQDAVFSTTKNAGSALMSCYRNVLRHGWPGGMGIGHSTYGALSGEIGRGYAWHGSYIISQQGLSVVGVDGSDSGTDGYAKSWSYIRQCWLVNENIDKVEDLSEGDKAIVKAETLGLIAYRYMGMLYRYGGIPIVRKSFLSTDDLSAPRASVKEVVDYICELCDAASAVLPVSWPAAYNGRLTKGAVLAIKGRTLLFAARPLFNSATPYLDNGSHNDLICFGNYDKERWKAAIDANEAVLAWAVDAGVELINTGGAGVGQPNPNAFDDYGKATSVFANPEIILAYKLGKQEGWEPMVNYLCCSAHQNVSRFDTDANGVLTNHLEQYWAADGTDVSWPKVGETLPHAGAEWVTKVLSLEPRAHADIKFGGFDSDNNPGDYYWSNAGWNRGGYAAEKNKASSFPDPINDERGCGERTKFFYHAGSRTWCEPPLFRLAETYMNLAEAYNEYGNTVKALENLNVVHNRAGLPAITETDQARLRAIIQREDAIEFFQENHRYFDVKHWKLPNVGNGICGGPMRMLQFNIKNDEAATWPFAAKWIDSWWDSVVYNSYWSDEMLLEPLPQTEVNKGTTVQNPGYTK